MAGCAEEEAEVSEGAKISDLFERYARRAPELAAFRTSVVASRNQEYTEWRAALVEGDEVAFLPPVSGGEEAEVCEDNFALVRERIAAEEVVAGVKAAEDGAVAVFEGIVRNHSGGRRTVYLEYEAYEAMALAKMREIAAHMHERFSIHRIAMVHRLGRLEIGETSVLIAVSAGHRAAALEACRYGIDTLKRVAPIWKKEFFSDGSMWADGEIPSQEAF